MASSWGWGWVLVDGVSLKFSMSLGVGRGASQSVCFSPWAGLVFRTQTFSSCAGEIICPPDFDYVTLLFKILQWTLL